MFKNSNIRQLAKRERREQIGKFVEALKPQALGARTSEPQAIELFATAISHLTVAHTTTYPALGPNYSPAPQITADFGDLILPGNGRIPGIRRHCHQNYSPRSSNTR